MFSTVLNWSTVFVVIFFLQNPALPAGTNPEKIVGNFQEKLVAVMRRSSSTSVKQRYDMLSPAVENSFHLPLMSKIIVGNYWNHMSQNERLELKSAFHRMSVSTLATLFNTYNGERFIYLKTKAGPSRTKLVYSHLLKSDTQKISIIYVTYKSKGGWRIIDVIVDGGISELKIRQSEYHRILQTKGIGKLIKLLNSTATRLMLE